MSEGTNYFPSFADAVRYYGQYGLDSQDVQRKVNEQAIHIGLPPHKPGYAIFTHPQERRYFYEKIV